MQLTPYVMERRKSKKFYEALNMINGGDDTGRSFQQRKLCSGGDDFAKAIAKLVVAQLCEIEGFQSFQHLALDTLSDVAVRYIFNTGKSAHYNANLSGRNECNVFDVILGLEELGSVQGFVAASDVDHCLAGSGIVREIVDFVYESEQIPFVFTVPKFPVTRERAMSASFSRIAEDPPGEHIPTWLPAFPDRNGRGMEGNAAKEEHSLLHLQKHLLSNGFEVSTFVDHGDAKAKRIAIESNPFLAAPLWDKEVASVVPPPVKILNDVDSGNPPVVENCVGDECVSVVEAFAPAIEGVKGARCEFREGKMTELHLNKKHAVSFKIGTRNKLLGRLADLSPE
ncbi:transcription initiation factor TFIID subunit 8 [Arachis hypogaea]|nr:transcription initiation factor TFIID subunit 8 [Arachis hypogaea]